MADEHYDREKRPPSAPSAAPTRGFATRYFLRCLAKNRRDPRNNIVEWLPYNIALVETSFVFIMLPVCTMLVVYIIVGIRCFPNLLTLSYGLAPRSFTIVAPVGSLLGGYAWFRCHFRTYPYNTQACINFDSEGDREIVLRQKIVTFVICGFAIPILSALIFLVLLS